MRVKKSTFLLLLVVLILCSTTVSADLLNIQGEITNSTGGSPSGDIQFLIYENMTGGNPIYNSSADFNGSIVNGEYDVLLGTNVTLSLVYGNTYYLEILINGEELDFDGNERQIFESGIGAFANIAVNGTINATGDVCTIGSNCLSDIPVSTLNGSGTANYLSKWSTSTTQTNSIVSEVSGGVNIGGTLNATNFYTEAAGGYDRTIIGVQAGDINDQWYVTLLGFQAGRNASGRYQTAVGTEAGEYNAGDGQVAVGYAAGNGNSANYQVAVGQDAGLGNDGIGQAVVGHQAGYLNSGSWHVGIGHWAGRSNSGGYLTGIGYNSGVSNEGHRSAGLGAFTLGSNIGNNTVAIGYSAGSGNTYNNRFIVHHSDASANTLLLGDFVSGVVNVSSGGDVCISGGNCLSAMTGGSGLGGSGTSGYIPLWNSSSTQENSIIIQISDGLNITGSVNLRHEVDAYKFGGDNFSRVWENGGGYTGTTVGIGAGFGRLDSTYIGAESGALAVGLHQTSVGYRAGYNNTRDRVTAIGTSAGTNNVGNYQTVVGFQAGQSNTGLQQTAIGHYSGNLNTGSRQLALGNAAGYRNAGADQIALGYTAGQDNAGNDTIGIGYEATKDNTGMNVVAIGREAGEGNSADNRFILKVSSASANNLLLGDFVSGVVNVSSGGDFCIAGGNCLSNASGSNITNNYYNQVGWTNTSTITSTDLNVNVTTGNISVDKGNIGVGIVATVPLHVNGLMMTVPTDTPGSCGASTKGAFYMDDSLSKPCYCNSTSWVEFENSSATC